MRDNMSIIKDSYMSGSKGDVKGMLVDIADNGKWTEMAGNIYAGTFTGQDEIHANVFARINGDWNNFAAVPSEFLDAGDTIIVLGEYSGTHKMTKKKFAIRYTHVWRLKNEKIISFEQFTDTAIMRYVANQPYEA